MCERNLRLKHWRYVGYWNSKLIWTVSCVYSWNQLGCELKQWFIGSENKLSGLVFEHVGGRTLTVSL